MQTSKHYQKLINELMQLSDDASVRRFLLQRLPSPKHLKELEKLRDRLVEIRADQSQNHALSLHPSRVLEKGKLRPLKMWADEAKSLPPVK